MNSPFSPATPGWVGTEFRKWIDNRRGVSPLYDAIVQDLVLDTDLLALIAEVGGCDYIYNRFMAAVHFLLLEGCRHPLSQFYATVAGSPGPVTEAYPHFRNFCFIHKEELLQLVWTREVQINEVRRCAALLPAFAWIRQRGCEPALALLDVGAAAGLNLLLDEFYFDYGPAGVLGDPGSPVRIFCKPRGVRAPVIPAEMLPIAWRMGIDWQPIDVADSHATNWMIALVSPDDNGRLSLLQAALEVARRHPPRIVKGKAGEVLPHVMAGTPHGLCLCLFHCFTTHHFDDKELACFDEILCNFGKKRDYHVVLMEWKRVNGKPQTQQPIPITVTSFVNGQRSQELLAYVDNRGGCEWLEWLAGLRHPPGFQETASQLRTLAAHEESY